MTYWWFKSSSELLIHKVKCYKLTRHMQADLKGIWYLNISKAHPACVPRIMNDGGQTVCILWHLKVELRDPKVNMRAAQTLKKTRRFWNISSLSHWLTVLLMQRLTCGITQCVYDILQILVYVMFDWNPEVWGYKETKTSTKSKLTTVGYFFFVCETSLTPRRAQPGRKFYPL